MARLFKELIVVCFVVLTIEAAKLKLGKMSIKINEVGLQIPKNLKFGNGRCHSFRFNINVTVNHPGKTRTRAIARIRIKDNQGNIDRTDHSLTIYKGDNIFAIRVNPRVCFCTINKEKVKVQYTAWLRNIKDEVVKIKKGSSDVPRDEGSIHPTVMCTPMPAGSDPYLDRKVKFEAYSEQYDYWTDVGSEISVGNPGKEGLCVTLDASAEIGTSRAPPNHICQRKLYVPPHCEMKKRFSCDVMRTTFPEKVDRELIATWIATVKSEELRWKTRLEENKNILHIRGL